MKNQFIENKKRLKSNQQGAVLLTVVVMSMILTMLIVAIMAFVGTASKQSTQQFSDEQAYYIASSSLKTFVDYLDSEDYSGKAIAELAASTASGNVQLNGNDVFNGSGSCTISVGYANSTDTDIIVVKATSAYAEQTAQAVAYFNVSEVPSSKKLSNAIEASGGATFNQAANALGNVISNTKGVGFDDNALSLNNTNTIFGTLHNDGNIIIKQMQASAGAGWHDNIDGTGSYIAATGSIVAGVDGQCAFSPYKGKSDTTATNDYNYMAAGKYFIAAGNVSIGATTAQQMDVYCQAAYLGGFTSADDAALEFTNYTGGTGGTSYVQYGNLYCYKVDGDTSDQNGSLIIGSNNQTYEPTINGNVYVEGDIILKNQNGKNTVINGNLYITKSIKVDSTQNNKLKVNGKIYCDLTGMSTADITALQNELTEWITASEMDGSKVKINNSPFAKAGRNEKPEVDLPAEQFNYASTEGILNNVGHKLDGTVFETYQSNLTVLRNTKLSTMKVADMTTDQKNATGVSGDLSNFSYYTEKSCYVDVSDGNIFVNMKNATSDIILLFPSSYSIDNKQIVIKNDTKHFCYLIVDNKESTSSFSLLQSQIIDYSLYKNFKALTEENGDGSGNKLSLNTTSYYDDTSDPGIIKNVINNDDIITPDLVKTVLMVPENASVSFGSGGSLIQALLYGPEATLNIYASGKMYIATNINYTNKSCVRTLFEKIAFIGSTIFEKYNFEEGTKSIYSGIYPGSVVEIINGGGTKTVIDFDHYEIR